MPRKKRVSTRKRSAKRPTPIPKLARRDVSKQTVAAVMVLAILVSLLGTWFVLDSLTSTPTVTSPGASATGGSLDSRVSVAVLDANGQQTHALGGTIAVGIR